MHEQIVIFTLDILIYHIIILHAYPNMQSVTTLVEQISKDYKVKLIKENNYG
jgi:tetrahydromethanopterin S-methyltransferase subunit F